MVCPTVICRRLSHNENGSGHFPQHLEMARRPQEFGISALQAERLRDRPDARRGKGSKTGR